MVLAHEPPPHTSRPRSPSLDGPDALALLSKTPAKQPGKPRAPRAPDNDDTRSDDADGEEDSNKPDTSHGRPKRRSINSARKDSTHTPSASTRRSTRSAQAALRPSASDAGASAGSHVEIETVSASKKGSIRSGGYTFKASSIK